MRGRSTLRSINATSRLLLLCVSLAACGRGGSQPALYSKTVAHGERLSHNCTPCHDLIGTANRIGPYLKGIIGRHAGRARGYEYSAAMNAADIVWTPEALEVFIQGPLSVVPGSKMALGEVEEEDAEDIVAYLKSLDR